MNRYRLDIQGLRAVAVLLVFFSHVDVLFFRGGFIGVDVFFVISGYVITQLITKECQNTNSFNYTSFYLKRFKRLFPALFFMMLSVSLAMYLLLPIQQFEMQLNGAASALAWVSNFYFLFGSQDYFAITEASENFFIHTWSLGVEEQFYLIWPFIIVFIFLKKNPHFLRLTLLVLLTTVSFLLSLYLANQSDKLSFYLMPARIWQFSLGSIAACLINYKILKLKKWNNFSLLFGFFGLISIVASAYILDETSRYPYFYSLFPTFGTFFILCFSASKTNLVGRILKIRPLVYMGNISYSFYLWHWPIILFVNLIDMGSPMSNVFYSFIVTLFMASFSYKFIETPFKTKETGLNEKRQLVGILMIIVLSSSFLIFLRMYTKNYIDYYLNDDFLKAIYDKPILYNHECDTWYESSELTKCIYGDNESSKLVVMFGDSVLAHWFPLVEKKYAAKDWKLVVLTKSACPIISKSYYYKKIGRNYEECDLWREKAIDYLVSNKPDVIIMGNSNDYPFDKVQWEDGLISTLDNLQQAEAKIKLVAGTPKLNFNGPLCLRNRLKNQTACETKLIEAENWELSKRLADEYRNLEFLEFSQEICPNNICQAQLLDEVVYSDNQHLTSSFVLSLYNKLHEKF